MTKTAANVLQTPDANSGYTGNTVSLTTSGQSAITFRFYAYGAESTAGTGGLQGNLTFSASLASGATPTITAVTLTNALTNTYGTASTGVSYTATGTNLTGQITNTPVAGWEISTNNSTWTTNATAVNTNTTMYVRTAATRAAGTNNGTAVVTLASAGATSTNVTTSASSNVVSQKGMTITASADSKTYGQTKAYGSGSTNFTSSGLQNSETIGSVTITASGGTATNSAVGSYTLTPSAATGGTFTASNYSITYNTNTLTVGVAPLTITANNINKVQGNTLTGGAGSTAFTSSGLQNGETVGTVTVTYGTGAAAGDAAGTYAGQVTPSAATGGTFTASNYSISYVSGDIIVSSTPTISAPGTLSAVSITYGTATVSPTSISVSGGNLTGNLSVAVPSGFEVSSDGTNYSAGPLTLTASSGTVGSTTIYVRLPATASVANSPYSGNLTISGGGATAVNIAIPNSTVTAKALTVSGAAATNRAYDGTTTIAVTGGSLTTGSGAGQVLSGDVANVTLGGSPTGSVSSKDVGNTKAVTVTGYSVSGTASGNYTVTQPTGLTADITAKALSVTAPTIASKTYNGTTAAGAVTVGTLTGFVGSETVTATGAAAAYSSANAGTYNDVTITYTLANGTNGGLASNYSLANGSATGTISTKVLTITANHVEKGVGDVLTGGAGSSAFTSSGLVGSETIGSVTISYGAGAASSAAIGAYNGTVTASAATGGTFNASNYAITYVAGNISVTGPFTAGNLVVARYGDGSTTLSSAATALNVVEINSSNGSTVQALSSVANGSFLLTDSGTATSDGYLNTYGTNLALPGYNSASGTADVASLNSKAVNILGTGATVLGRVLFPTGGANATPPSPFSTNNFRSVVATDTNKFYASGNSSQTGTTPVTGGIWYYNGSAFTQICTNPASNTRNVEIYNGNLYFSTGSGTRGIYQVGSGLPTTSGQTGTLVIATDSPYGFAISPDGNTAYVADDNPVSGNTGGGIQKWTKSESTWTRQYTFATQARGLTVDFSGANPVIYATTTATSNNKIIKITDTGSSATSSDVASAGANYVFRGVDFSPSPPTISTSGTLSAVSTTYGTASSSTQFSVSGANMTAGIMVTPPAGFEVSTDNTTFSSTVTVGSAETIASTTVYVRLAATASAGSYSGNIVLSSSGATSVNLATVSSTVTAAALPAVTWGTSTISSSGGVASFSYLYTGRSSNGISTTYSNSAVPTAAGYYTAVATSTDGNYSGSSTNTYFVAGPVAGNDAVIRPTNNTTFLIPRATLLQNDARIDTNGVVFSNNLSITGVTAGTGSTAVNTNQPAFVTFTAGGSGVETFTYTLADAVTGLTTTGTVTVTPEANQAMESFTITGSPGAPTYDGFATKIKVNFTGTPNTTYTIYFTTNLANGPWQNGGGWWSGSTGTFEAEFWQEGNHTSAWGSMFFKYKK